MEAHPQTFDLLTNPPNSPKSYTLLASVQNTFNKSEPKREKADYVVGLRPALKKEKDLVRGRFNQQEKKMGRVTTTF